MKRRGRVCVLDGVGGGQSGALGRLSILTVDGGLESKWMMLNLRRELTMAADFFSGC